MFASCQQFVIEIFVTIFRFLRPFSNLTPFPFLSPCVFKKRTVTIDTLARYGERNLRPMPYGTNSKVSLRANSFLLAVSLEQHLPVSFAQDTALRHHRKRFHLSRGAFSGCFCKWTTSQGTKLKLIEHSVEQDSKPL